MRNSILWISAFAAALIAGCGEIAPLAAPAAHSGDANFSVYAAMGTSITAGWQSGGLVDYHQRHSYAAVFDQPAGLPAGRDARSEEHTSELQSHSDLVCRLLLEKKKKESIQTSTTSVS